MLCHTALHRAAQVARHWTTQGCPVVIHLDSRVADKDRSDLSAALADLPNLHFCRRIACEWGTFSLVEAAIEGASLMLQRAPGVGHVYLASGSCLPIRPVAELQGFLAAHPDTDFIESVTTADVGWTVGGLNKERFTLRFPFAWKRQRRLFDGYVELQRKLGVQRSIPAGLVPHLGSQWWCLTRETLTKILNHPERARNDRYFRRVWIPDESYFQTLVRTVEAKVESRSLTLSKFDYLGRPHVFYDDHLHLLRQTEAFVARKIWPQADVLYDTYLAHAENAPRLMPNPGKIDRLFAKAVERRTKGRPGLVMQSRFPARAQGGNLSAAPYGVFQGFSELYPDFQPWLARVAEARVHGHLFAPEKAEFAGDEAVFKGGLSSGAALRDYNPRSFLTSLIWNTRGERQCFQFGARDAQEITSFLAGDPNASVMIVSGAFAVPLWRSGRPFAEIRAEAARLQKIEADFIALLQAPEAKARSRVWTLADFVENPVEPLHQVVDDLNPRAPHRMTEVPLLTDLTGFADFVQELRNQGMQPVLLGDFHARLTTDPAGAGLGRPKVIK
jgi:hypothetical protein